MSDDQEELHPIFTRDPSDWKNLVYQIVEVTTEDGQSHIGAVYTVDPVSETVVLVTENNEGDLQLNVVMGHAVQSTEVRGECEAGLREKMEKLFKPAALLQLSKDELGKRKTQLRSWLLKNRIPIEVCADNEEVLSISDVLFIEPPYSVTNCRSTNEIVLGRVQGLIKNMPNEGEKT